MKWPCRAERAGRDRTVTTMTRMFRCNVVLTFAVLTVLLSLQQTEIVEARCPNDCTGHGNCNSDAQCECYSNYKGNDCSKRNCPVGHAWTGYPLEDHDLHAQVRAILSMQRSSSKMN